MKCEYQSLENNYGYQKYLRKNHWLKHEEQIRLVRKKGKSIFKGTDKSRKKYSCDKEKPASKLTFSHMLQVNKKSKKNKAN